MTLGEKIKKLRCERNLTQDEFAEKLFVTRTAVSKWETNNGYPSIDILKTIAVFFNTTIDELLSEEDIKNKQSQDSSNYKANNNISLVALGVCIACIVSLFIVKNALAIGCVLGLAILNACIYLVFTELAIFYFKDKKISKKQASINKIREVVAAVLLFLIIMGVFNKF